MSWVKLRGNQLSNKFCCEEMKLKSLLVFFILFNAFLFHAVSSGNENQCASATSCGQCIRLPACVWCPNTGTTERIAHCIPKELSQTCPSDLLGANPSVEYIVHDKLRRAIYQMRPQRASLNNIRLGQPFNISISYTVAENYPVDLYYLMDMSHSMLKHKQVLAQIAETLVETMNSLTSDFRLGFGSFVDKNALPFIERPYHESQCIPSQPHTCQETYLFRHHLALNYDVNEFIEKVNSTQIVLTFDDPEGGLEALVQAMVCKQHIGWRDQVRRLVVFATDANSHLAGNGRLAGILNPNDGLCHLDSRGHYDHALAQDYPSLGQVSRLAKQNAINTIFAVTAEVARTYEAFSRLVPFADVGVVASNASNLADIIVSKYEKMASMVEMKDSSGRGLKTRYFSRCTHGGALQETSKCENLKIRDTVEFIVSIEATECPGASGSIETINFYPAGINETFKLDVKVACDCDCEKPGNEGFVSEAPECNSSGNLTCGVCQCDDLHSGRFCECSGNTDHLELDDKCRNPAKRGVDSEPVCSGRGQCVCGKCECDARPDPQEAIGGEYCECDNFSCPRGDGVVCSGNGRCECGTCRCDGGFSGLACDCRTSNASCVAPGDKAECSGNGACSCAGTCQCRPEASGEFCQLCPTCPSRCEDYTPCVQCRLFRSGPYMTGDRCDELCDYPIEVQPEVQALESWERECRFKNESGCETVFVYSVHPETAAKRVVVQEESVCPGPVNLIAVAFGLFGAILAALLGMLLFFRLTTYLYDRREYAKFIEESKTWQNRAATNPLYKEATSTFRNPAYGGTARKRTT